MTVFFLAVSALGMLVFFLLRLREERGGRQGPVSRISGAETIGDGELLQDVHQSVMGDESVLLAVADGTGSGGSGKLAAGMAAQVAVSLYAANEAACMRQPAYYFRRVFYSANKRLLALMGDGAGRASAALALVADGCLHYGVVGSCRVALFRQGDLIPLCEGQTISSAARKRYREGKLTRRETAALLDEERAYNFLGQDGISEPELSPEPIPLEKGDLVVLMTEGVFHALSWRSIEEALAGREAARVIEQVKGAPGDGKDNASLLVMDYQGDY